MLCINMIKQCLFIVKLTMTQVTRTYENNPEFPYEIINMSVVLQLQAGQEVWLRPDSMTSIYGAMECGPASLDISSTLCKSLSLKTYCFDKIQMLLIVRI